MSAELAVMVSDPGMIDRACEISEVVHRAGLKVAVDRTGTSICAVGALRRVYERDGAEVLGRALTIIRDAYGGIGLKGPVIDGIGLLCHRYNGKLKDDRAVSQLSSAHGGVAALLVKAELLRKQVGAGQPQCIAAAAVEIINRGKGASLPSWWRNQDGSGDQA